MARAAKGAVARPAAAAQAAEPEGQADLVTAATRHVALLAAIIATCGSLYFSEVLGWIPCELCWYQRILMYPLVVILAAGILRDDRGVHWYVLPLSLTGMAVSLYHLLMTLQVIPPADCAGGVPCSVDYLAPYFTGVWSFIRIPGLAFAAFTIISVMMGNYAIAGAPGFGAARRRTAGIVAAAIVAATILVFVLMAALR
jgi:disulfide bond formation protein DsbB